MWTTGNGYALYSSANLVISSHRVSERVGGDLFLYLSTATENCPALVEIDRNEKSIKKVTLKCDPLALSTTQENAG